jgi:hypothetical protein
VLRQTVTRPPGSTQTVTAWVPMEPPVTLPCRVSTPQAASPERPAGGGTGIVVERTVTFSRVAELTRDQRGRITITRTGELLEVELLEPTTPQSFEVRRTVRVRVITP